MVGVKYSPPLRRAELIRRYKRFLADVRLEDGREITIHCPNTGSMKNCGEPGDDVFFSTSDNPKRKYAHTWELCRTHRGHYIGINSAGANDLVKAAVLAGTIGELQGYREIRAEYSYGSEASRADLFLSGHATCADCCVEVKSVTLLEPPIRQGRGFFPDAVSERGTKHLRELARVAGDGGRAVLFFCVQHSGIRSVAPADHIDPAYGETLRSAIAEGVEVIAYKARLSPRGIRIAKRLPVVVDR